MESTNQLDLNGWHLNTSYVINFDVVPAEVRVEFSGETIAWSSKTRVMYEQLFIDHFADVPPRKVFDVADIQRVLHHDWCLLSL